MLNNQTLFDEEILDSIKTRFIDYKIDYNLYIKNKLFIDFGNSNAKLLFNNELYTVGYENIEFELLEIISEYLDKEENKKTDTFEIYYSNVKKLDIKKIGEYLINQVKINYLFDISIDFINVREIIDSEIVKKSFNYQNVKGIGTDRLLGLYLAFSYFPKETNITIDFGTAITLNIIDKNGNVLGGQIFPGLFLQINSLNLNTAGINLDNQNVMGFLYNKVDDFKLNQSNSGNFNQIGNNTFDAVLNGIFSNILGAIINFMNAGDVLGNSPKNIIFTGTYSKVFFDAFNIRKSKIKNEIENLNNINLHHSNLLNIYAIVFLSKIS